jgi:ASC-1-like (ASCH) protein
VVQAGKSYRIEVRLRADKLPKGVVAEKLKVYTNLKDKPVGVIPIRVRKE